MSLDEDGLVSELGPLLAVPPDTGSTGVRLIGELDMSTAHVLNTLIEQQIAIGQLEVRLDLSGLRFCDVFGLRALLGARRRLAAADGQLVLLRPTPLLLRLATLCGWSAELGMPAWMGCPPSAASAPRPEPAAKPITHHDRRARTTGPGGRGARRSAAPEAPAGA